MNAAEPDRRHFPIAQRAWADAGGRERAGAGGRALTGIRQTMHEARSPCACGTNWGASLLTRRSLDVFEGVENTRRSWGCRTGSECPMR